jgi:hypothetical protein
MKGDNWKWIFTFFVLSITIGWAVFLVETVKNAANNPTSGGVIEASGVGVLLGALITWVGITVNYFFRKKPPTDGQNGR